MSNEIKVGDWTITPTGFNSLENLHAEANRIRNRMDSMAVECCEILGIDPAGCSLAKDFAEAIVLESVPPMEAIGNIKRHLASPHSGDFS
jgi:hypothetical protein